MTVYYYRPGSNYPSSSGTPQFQVDPKFSIFAGRFSRGLVKGSYPQPLSGPVSYVPLQPDESDQDRLPKYKLDSFSQYVIPNEPYNSMAVFFPVLHLSSSQACNRRWRDLYDNAQQVVPWIDWLPVEVRADTIFLIHQVFFRQFLPTP